MENASSCCATITSAKYLKFSAARAACPFAWVIGSPVSKVSSAAARAARRVPLRGFGGALAGARPPGPGRGPGGAPPPPPPPPPVAAPGRAGRGPRVPLVGPRAAPVERPPAGARPGPPADEVLDL